MRETGQQLVNARRRLGEVRLSCRTLVGVERKHIEQGARLPATKAGAMKPGTGPGASLRDTDHLPAIGVENLSRTHTTEADQ
jgi:hypothetical protein